MSVNEDEHGLANSEEPKTPPPGPQADAAEPSEAEQARAELEEALRERDQYKDALQRAIADFTNYRRRMEEEREELQRNATADFIVKLLPVLDDLERALASPLPEESPGEHQWWEGVNLISRKFRVLLDDVGVHVVEAEGKPFDPWEQEVVSYEKSEEQAEGKVISVARQGYKLHGRVLRPALVVVAKEPTNQENEQKENKPEEEN